MWIDLTTPKKEKKKSSEENTMEKRVNSDTYTIERRKFSMGNEVGRIPPGDEKDQPVEIRDRFDNVMLRRQPSSRTMMNMLKRIMCTDER